MPSDFLTHALSWFASLGPYGPVAFILVYAAVTVGFWPGSVLTLGAGVLFGVFWGSVYVFFGATLGATMAFWVGRHLLRDWVSRKINHRPQFQAIDAAVGRSGFKIVLLTRLSPLFPFNFLNYAYGVTQVSLKDYVLASVGMIPGTVLYVYIGSLAGSLATLGSASGRTDSGLQWGVRIFGLVATIAVTVYITRVARQALADMTTGNPSGNATANTTVNMTVNATATTEHTTKSGEG
jgi:uncharacterized membrane protein YdjX (TVP38/TMEM64 family)